MRLTPLELIEIRALDDYYDYSDAWVIANYCFVKEGNIADLKRARNILTTNVHGMYYRLFWKHCKYWDGGFYDDREIGILRSTDGVYHHFGKLKIS
jgi:hypothetical protein